MTVKIVDDINVKDREGYYYLYPNSVRRDIEFEFTPPTNVRKRKDKPFAGKEI